MIDCCRASCSLIRVQTPAFLLPFLDYFANILMMANLNAFPLFQLVYYHLF